MKNYLFYLVVVILTICSCFSKLPPEKYLSYFEKEMQKKAVRIKRNGVTVSVCNIPSDYYIARELLFDKKRNVEELKSAYKDALYFSVSVDDTIHTNGMSLEKFKYEQIKKTFNTKNMFLLTSSQDTIKSINVNYDKSWGVAKTSSYVVSFLMKESVNIKKYNMQIRDIYPAFGTIEIDVKRLLKVKKKVIKKNENH